MGWNTQVVPTSVHIVEHVRPFSVVCSTHIVETQKRREKRIMFDISTALYSICAGILRLFVEVPLSRISYGQGECDAPNPAAWTV